MLAGSPSRLAESSSSSYGLVVRLLLLPTPPHDDAVTGGYGPESVCPKGTFTPLTVAPFGRASTSIYRGARDRADSPTVSTVSFYLVVSFTFRSPDSQRLNFDGCEARTLSVNDNGGNNLTGIACQAKPVAD